MSHSLPPILKGDLAANLLSAIIDSSDDAIVSKDLNGVVTSWNRSAERIFGYTAEEMIGHPILILLPKDRQAEEFEILARIRRGERIDHFETFRQRKDGKLIDVSVTISPIHEPGGKIIGASKVARDITEQKRGGEASLLLAAIVNSSDDAIISKNLNGIITSWNAGAQRMFGYTQEETVGRSVLMLVPTDRQDEEPKILERLRRGERVEHFETVRVRKNGQQFHVSLTISPVKDLTGRVIGASKIARDVTEFKLVSAEREQLLQSERVARSQAENANRMKDEFLATVSHELRTPLNAIVGWTQLLKDCEGEQEEIAHAVAVIERNARAQAQLIDELLDLGRIVSGKMTLDVQSIDIAGVVQDVIATVQHTADLKSIRVKIILNGIRGSMMGDKQRLQQILWNLLVNAIKFTPKDGSVILSVDREASQVEISVTDTGCGIAPEFLPHVFERFRQGDSTTTRQHSGLGIGLALVKQLTELHGGVVRAESPGLGKGATFTVKLPVVVTRPLPEETSTQGAPAREELFDMENLSGIRVLVVDDDKDSLEMVKRILSNRHALVETAESVGQAIKLFTSFHPHVVLSDIGMPGQDGYEFIRRVRQLPGGNSVPAAALTALARSEDRMRALQAGFQTHVAKPIAPNELVAVVRSLAALREISTAGAYETPVGPAV
jgi:PAS domain S-box-containing protein